MAYHHSNRKRIINKICKQEFRKEKIQWQKIQENIIDNCM